MLKKTSITKICQHLKIDQAKLEAALADKAEVEIDIPDDLTVLTKPELTTRDKNQYDTGKKAGEEMTVKELKKKHGLDFAGDDPEKLIEALQKKIKAELDLNPDARVKELETTLATAKNALLKANGKVEQLETEKLTMQADNELLSLLPQDRLEIMTNEEYLALSKSRLKIEVKDGKKVVVKDGQPVLDPKTMEPVAPAEAIKGFFGEKKWLKDPAGNGNGGGRGGGNSTPGGKTGKFQKLSEVRKHVEDQGKNPYGEEGQRMLQAAITENPDIDMTA
jgi:hypothetical protein